MKPTIDAEFAALCPPLRDEEYRELEASLKTEGCRDALITWRGILVDGHHRLQICETYGIPFEESTIVLPDRDAAKIWIIKNQFARRNLAPLQRAELALELEPLIAARSRQGERTDLLQKSAKSEPLDTRQEVAKIAGLSHDTIAKAKVILEQGTEATKASLRRGESSINREYEAIRGRPHVAQASGENEWYTPPEYVEAARKVLGAIDCDPASSEVANRTVRATKFYGKADQGQRQKWGKRVWMNPPYGQPVIAEFAAAMCAKIDSSEVTHACVLVNNATETEWFQSMLSRADGVCFIRGRISFLNSEGKAAEKPLQGQAVLYFGPDINGFAEAFRDKGIVLRR